MYNYKPYQCKWEIIYNPMVMTEDYSKQIKKFLLDSNGNENYNDIIDFEVLEDTGQFQNFVKLIFEDHRAIHRFLKAYVQQYCLKDSFELNSGIYTLIINEIYFIIKVVNSEIEYVFTDPFYFFRLFNTNDFELIRQVYKMKLLFDILYYANITTGEEKLIDFVLAYSKLLDFYPHLIYENNLPEVSCVYSQFNYEDLCSPYCLESGIPIMNGVFLNSAKLREFRKKDSKSSDTYVDRAFIKDVLEVSQRVDEFFFNSSKNQKDLTLFKNIKPLKVIIDKCRKHIVRKVNMARLSAQLKPQEPDFMADRTGINATLEYTFKESYTKGRRLIDNDEKITAIDFILFSKLSEQQIKMIQAKNYEAVDFQSLVDQGISSMRSFFNIYQPFGGNVVAEYFVVEVFNLNDYSERELVAPSLIEVDHDVLFPILNLLYFNKQLLEKKPLDKIAGISKIHYSFFKTHIVGQIYRRILEHEKNSTLAGTKEHL